MRKILAGAALVLVLAAPQAHALAKGNSMFALELTHGMADLYTPDFSSTGYISAYDHSEQGLQGQYWMMMSPDYAPTVTAGWASSVRPTALARLRGSARLIRHSQSSPTSASAATAWSGSHARSSTSTGPRVQSGKAKFEGGGFTTVETRASRATTSRPGLARR